MNEPGINSSITEKLFQIAQNVKPVANARVVSAVVYKGSTIVGLGINTYKTHPRAKELHDGNSKECLHAEMNAIFQAQRIMDDLSACDIYVVRAKRRVDMSMKNYAPKNEISYWEYGQSKPCLACKKLIDEVKIKRIFCTV